jgi:GNAT superfamily N-acetyltransferase
VDRQHLDRYDVVGVDMELTMTAPEALSLRLELADRRTGWDDVVAEMVRSCSARAEAHARWQRPGAIAVLTGPAPVAWVHGAVDVDELVATLDGAADVCEAYVDRGRPGTIAALVAAGWSTAEVMAQMVATRPAPMAVRARVSADLPAVEPLGADDLDRLRALLLAQGCEPEVLAASYPDDFFTVAAPVQVFGARDAAGQLVGSVAVRRQSRGALGFALNVAAGWQGRGLGRALVVAGLDAGFATGAEFVHAQAGQASAGLLTSCGFTGAGAWQRLIRR